MSTNKTNAWDALCAMAPAAILLAFFLGVGGCCYLLKKGDAELERAKATIGRSAP